MGEGAGILMLEEYEMSEQEFSRTNTEPFATVKSTVLEVETDGENLQHIGVINAWADAILRGGKLVADGREGINSIMLSNAIHLSSFLGKEVEIPFDEDLFYNELMKRVAGSKVKTNIRQIYADTAVINRRCAYAEG